MALRKRSDSFGGLIEGVKLAGKMGGPARIFRAMSTRRLRLFPLKTVLFPGAVLNLHVFESRYKRLIEECLEDGDGFGVALISEGSDVGDSEVMPHEIGSVAEIVGVRPLPEGRYFISTIGRERFRIRAIVSRDPYLVVDADVLEEDDAGAGDGVDGDLVESVRAKFAEYAELICEFSGEDAAAIEPDEDPRSTSYAVGDALQVADAIKQRLLELSDTRARLEAELQFLARLLPPLKRLVERRKRELELRRIREGTEEDDGYRSDQARYFGRYFSRN